MKLRPHMVKSFMLAGATDSINGVYDRVGLGGIDYLSCAWNVKAGKVWEGPNSNYSYFDSVDPYPNNGFIDYKVHFSCGSPGWEDIRIVLSWLNRGTYIYSHRSDPYPLGMDFDMKLLDPNGNCIADSASRYDSFEVINFTPATEGYYTIRIQRVSNRDTNSKLCMALAVNAYTSYPKYVNIGSHYSKGFNNNVEFYGWNWWGYGCTHGYATCRGAWWIDPCKWESYCSTGWDTNVGYYYSVNSSYCDCN